MRRDHRQQPPHLLLILSPQLNRREAGVSRKPFAADAPCERVPYGLLHDHIKVVVGPARLALDRVAELPAAGIVAGTRRVLQAVGRHRIFGERPARKALLVTELDATEVHAAVDHRDFDELTLARALTLVKRSQDTDHEVQAGAGVA